MLIRYVGPRTKHRLWGPYVFSRENGYSQEIACAEEAAGMLTHPGDQFAIDAAEPLLQIVSAEEAGLLALAGVASVEDLAGLNAAGEKAVARECRVGVRKVRGWMRAAIAAKVAYVEKVAPTKGTSEDAGLEKRG